jgi:signal transduction histidine kinase
MLFTAGPGITLGLVTAGPAFRIGSLVYLIHPIFGVYVFPRWRTVLLLTLVGLEYGALLHIQHDVAPAGQWGFFMIILVVTAVITGGLVDQLDRLAASEHDARLALAEASRQKSAFLAAMSHELRTPLNAIIGFSEVLRDRVFGELNEKQEEYVSDVVGSGQHLLALINDILDLSKVEAGRMELEVSAVDVAALVQSAVAFVRADLARNAIALTIELEPEAGVIHGDGQKLRQVLINLLSNAVKFTPDHGSVRVSVTHARGNLVITVADTGPGIAPEDQERIFEEFAQAGAAEQSRQPGTGLGLTLARRFTELHQGRLSVDSVVGVGSTFRLEVPAGG